MSSRLMIDFAGPEDYPSFARLLPELAAGDPLPAFEEWCSDYLPTTLVARIDGDVAGYLFYQLLTGVVYVRHVVVAPAHRRRGVGRALLFHAAQRFRSAGATEWCLNVKPDNGVAIHLYCALGMTRAYSSMALRIRWSDVANLGGSTGVGQREIGPRDDVLVEGAFSLPTGQLAEERRHRNRRVLGLFDQSAPVGVAVFNVSFPGARPFRVARGELARDLLEAMRPHARSSDETVGVVVENDPVLAEHLQRAGASVRLQFDHYRGLLPPDLSGGLSP
jgi:GNAT superfamily N-acetyltransferase